jgi:hypothetical protein
VDVRAAEARAGEQKSSRGGCGGKQMASQQVERVASCRTGGPSGIHLSPILFITGIHFPPVILHNQGYPKVCPDSLNLPNAGNPFAGTSLLSSHSLFSPTRDLIASI